MAEWCHTFDFTEGQQGWTPVNSGAFPNYGVYDAGMGWRNTGGSYCEAIIIQSPTFAATLITSMTIYLDTPTTRSTSGPLWQTCQTTNWLRQNAGAGLEELIQVINGNLTCIRVGMDNSHNTAAAHCYSGHIKKVLLRGQGVNPFVSSTVLLRAGQTVFIYRAPITGNDSDKKFDPNSPNEITISGYAIDPLTKHLWLKAAAGGQQGWVKVRVSTPTVLKPVGCDWVEDAAYTGSDRVILPSEGSGLFLLEAI